MKNRRKFFVGGVLLICLCLLAIVSFEYICLPMIISREIISHPIWQRGEFISFYNQFGGLNLRPGMSMRQVEAILGLPQNVDCQTVWAWSLGNKQSKQDCKWLDLYYGYSIIYMIFFNDQLIGDPLCLKVSDCVTPVEFIMSVENCSEHEALIKLGLSELEIKRYSQRGEAYEKAWKILKNKTGSQNP